MTELEAKFWGYVQSGPLNLVRVGDVADALQIAPRQEQALLQRLARSGLLYRLCRGRYVVPERMPLGGRWSPSEACVLTTLMAELKGAYQLTGPSAFHRYGWDTQVPQRLHVYNNRLSGERTVGAVAVSFMRVADGRLGGSESSSTPDGFELIYSSRIRTLVDAVYDWSRFDSLPRGYGWIRSELRADPRAAAELVDATLQFGNTGTIRRIGWLLESEGVNAFLLRKLERNLPESAGLIAWIPNRPKRGTIHRRWGVVVNAP